MQVLETVPRAVVPCEHSLRRWIGYSLHELRLKPADLARESGVAGQTIRHFLNAPGRGLHSTNMHDISCGLYRLAEEQGIELPVLGGTCEHCARAQEARALEGQANG